MKIINKDAFRVAQKSSREAVEIGLDGGGEFDWHIAMIFLKVAYGKRDFPGADELDNLWKDFNDAG